MFKRSLSVLPTLLVLACTGRPADPGETATSTDATSTGGPGGTSGATVEPTGGGPAGGTMTAPFDSSGTDGTNSTGGTDGTGTSTGTTSGTTSTTTGASSTAGPDPVACDPWIEDCPEGQKCSAYADDGGNDWNAYKCVPIAPQPDQAGDPCTIEGSPVSGLDSCDKHLQCWSWGEGLEGHCVPLCTGTQNNATCEDPEAYCALSGDGVLQLCLPSCDPLLQDCEADQACIPDINGPRFICVPQLDGAPAGQVFDTCEFANACAPGLVCVPPMYADECDPNVAGCCLPHCDLSLPNDCPGAGQVCLPWFEDDPPPKYENVGLCGVPQ